MSAFKAKQPQEEAAKTAVGERLIAARGIDSQAVEDIALGATFLGAGGGGATYATELQIKQLLDSGKSVNLLHIDDLEDDEIVAPCGWLGAPGTQKEKLPSGYEGQLGLKALEAALGKKVAAIMPIEIGGQNGIAPFLIAAQTGLPVLDGDGMGRAFPQSNMVTFNIYGMPATPAVATDTHGNNIVLNTYDSRTLEKFVRELAVAMGGHCHLFDYPMTAASIRRYAVPGTITTAWSIGATIRRARETKSSPFDALDEYLKSTEGYSYIETLHEGKIVDVDRRFEGGFLVGDVTVSDQGQQDDLRVQFQNEFIFAERGGQILASVPDIVAILDRDTARPINTESLKYGQRVAVVATRVPDILRTEHALSFVGPQAFGLPFEYTSIEEIHGGES